ncbi:MAG: flagellar protein FlbB [Treponemataceae bacterium]|nr:flagellar protein FlbB [Treponemataceae bacterium]
MGFGKSLGKTIVLLILVIILILGGLLWFDYLGVINAKSMFAPFYRMIGKEPQTTVPKTTSAELLQTDLDEERLAKRLEELSLRSEELDKRELDIQALEAENTQISQELEERRISQEEREKTFNNIQKMYDDRNVNIRKNAENLNGMAPANAVAILNEMDDQDIIDTLRMVDQIAAEEGTSSMVSYWLSLMPANRVAELQRKMANKPTSL